MNSTTRTQKMMNCSVFYLKNRIKLYNISIKKLGITSNEFWQNPESFPFVNCVDLEYKKFIHDYFKENPLDYGIVETGVASELLLEKLSPELFINNKLINNK